VHELDDRRVAVRLVDVQILLFVGFRARRR